VALDGVSLDVPRGCLVGVLGPNGSGKSSLLKALVGAVPSTGAIHLSRSDASSIAYVPQQSAIDLDFPVTVQDVVEQGRYPHLGLFRRFGAEDRAQVANALARTDLTELAGRQIGELSGGQRQRAFVARALAQGAQTLLLDEPFAGVDATTESSIIAVLRELRDSGATVIVVHHDLNSAPKYFDHLVLLRTQLIAAGPTGEVFTRPNLQKTYGGQVAVFGATE
jgi:manganese/zinc/iron transport system ATP- binding protein